MPCHAAISEKVITLPPEMEIEEALEQMKKSKIDHVAVVDSKGILVGYFSSLIVLKNLLPINVAMADGIQLDVTVRAAPGVAKRLRKLYPVRVEEIMERKVHVVYPQTPIWEGVNALITYGSPIFVVEAETRRYMGMINGSSVVEELQRMQESEVHS